MTLREYLQDLKVTLDYKPEILDYEMVVAVDEEDDGKFNTVFCAPSVGYLDSDGGFTNTETNTPIVCMN